MFPLVEVVGYDASVGFTQWANKPSTKNADIVDLFLAAGAIPFVKTNVPQTMLAFECSNPLWGRTVNPHASAYTSGGSSGGEAALLAMSGSALGFGSDIGGSLRIPTSYCGIYALKPGHGRVSTNGGKCKICPSRITGLD
jgi:Asp-tRNA(Asn)/Glu-tRNA(Gln) amidotransferase A subunit family amidase